MPYKHSTDFQHIISHVQTSGVTMERLEGDFHWGGHLPPDCWEVVTQESNLVALDGGWCIRLVGLCTGVAGVWG